MSGLFLENELLMDRRTATKQVRPAAACTCGTVVHSVALRVPLDLRADFWIPRLTDLQHGAHPHETSAISNHCILASTTNAPMFEVS